LLSVCLLLWTLYTRASRFDSQISQLKASEVSLDLGFTAAFVGNWMYLMRPNCSRETVADRFFMHLYPQQLTDLVPEARDRGFDVYDFDWQSARESPPLFSKFSNLCIARRFLPDYSLTSIGLGQFSVTTLKRTWEAQIKLSGTLQWMR